MRRALNVLAMSALALGACVPELVDDTSIVTSPRLLAVRAEPAEAEPGAEVALRGLWAASDGGAAPLGWAFCTARKPFTEPGNVDPACLVEDSPDLVAIGDGETVTGTLPDDGCRLFGPDRPTPMAGEPAGRPADPDGTGGYYQPVRVRADGDPPAFALAQVRIRCGLPAATPEQAADYKARVHANSSPAITAITGDGAAVIALEADPTAVTTVARGATLALRVAWPGCGTDEQPCAGAESYVWFDPDARALVTRREAIRVTWFATAGAWASARTGRAEAEADQPSTENSWIAPGDVGEQRLWIVVRDDRGGATWATVRIAVAP
ncbi:MAG: hypothetical protein K8W52_34705 [Deltaproteobacteria bacterium]|nr:hypothetical protein [Deltaproteobacteria bacterium]